MTPFDITPADIEACTSERLLRLWHGRFQDQQDDLMSLFEAAKLSGNLTPRRFVAEEGEMRNARYKMRLIERRALDLGVNPILSRKKQHGALQVENEQLRRERAALEARVAELETRLADVEQRRAA